MQEQNQRTSPWLIAWRVIFTFALIGCIVFIFSNSLQIADVSEGASGRVLGILQGILRHLGLPGAADRLTMHIVRKLAHFCEYLLEGFLLMLCLRVYTRHFFKHVSWPMLGGLLTALTDETIQLFVPGRSGQVTDIWIDFSGVMTGLLVGLILLGYGILQVGLSLQSHDPSQRSNGILTIAGGIVITFTKEILTLITGG